MMPLQSWSQSALGDDEDRALSVFQESLPVQLIATGRSDFKTCLPDETLSDVVERNRAAAFDFLPVVETPGGETVAGVLEVAALMSQVGRELVRDRMQLLGETHLLGADASILTFIRDADRQPFRFVISGPQISGLVTLSDLQRLPVRAALFAMVTHLEMIMADVIRHRSSGGEGWMGRLSESRAKKVRAKLEAARKQDTLIDPILYTEFGDKVTILRKELTFARAGLTTKTRFARDMKGVEALRNKLAHASNFAATRSTARTVCGSVRSMDRWIGHLAVMGSQGA